MLISHCLLQLHQGDGTEKRWDVFAQTAARTKLDLTETREILMAAAQVCAEPLSFGACYTRACVCMPRCLCVCVCAHMCMCEGAQVDCELGRWTFGAALHPAAKCTHTNTRTQTHGCNINLV